MAIDPKIFKDDPYGPFPDDGTDVICEVRNSERFIGRVVRVWRAMDAVCIVVLDMNGDERNVFPEFGDRWITAKGMTW